MRPAVFLLGDRKGLPCLALPCLAMCLHVSSSRYICNCLPRWSLWITTLNGSLLWSSYLQFACSVELCGSLLWSLILPIQRPALPTPPRKLFMVGQVSPLKFPRCDGAGWWLLGGLVPAHRVAMEPPCCAWYFRGSHTNLSWHQFLSSSTGAEFNRCSF